MTGEMYLMLDETARALAEQCVTHLNEIAALEALALELAAELDRLRDVVCEDDNALIDSAMSSPLLAELRAKDKR